MSHAAFIALKNNCTLSLFNSNEIVENIYFFVEIMLHYALLLIELFYTEIFGTNHTMAIFVGTMMIYTFNRMNMQADQLQGRMSYLMQNIKIQEGNIDLLFEEGDNSNKQIKSLKKQIGKLKKEINEYA
jgi:hypothetical protein